jgi:hypothetical protein
MTKLTPSHTAKLLSSDRYSQWAKENIEKELDLMEDKK